VAFRNLADPVRFTINLIIRRSFIPNENPYVFVRSKVYWGEDLTESAVPGPAARQEQASPPM